MPLLFSPILPSLCGILRICFPIIRCSLFPLLLRSHGIHGTLFQRGCNWLNLVASSKIMCEVLFHILPEWCRRFLFFGFLQVGLFTSLFLVFFLAFLFLSLSFLHTHPLPSLHPSFPLSGLPSWPHSVFIFLLNKRGVLFTLSTQVPVVQSLSRVQIFATPRTAARQAYLSFTVSWSLLRLIPTELVMPSNHVILWHPSSPPALNLSQHQGLFILLGAIGLPRWLRGEESACQCRTPQFDPWVGEIPLEKEMAAHCSILSWEIPWTEEPGGL